MNIDIIKGFEPINGEWRIEKLISSNNCSTIFYARNGKGVPAYIRTILLPGHRMIAEYESTYGKSEKTNNKLTSDVEAFARDFLDITSRAQELSNRCSSLLKIYGYGSLVTSAGYCVYTIEECSTTIEDNFNKKVLTDTMVFTLALDISDALQFCEKEKLLHGCVTTDNVFIINGKYKLGNFGLDELLINTKIKERDKYLTAPDRVQNGSGYQYDIYTFALLLYSLYNYKRFPFVPSHTDTYLISEQHRDNALKQRLESAHFPTAQYALKSMSDIIEKCFFSPDYTAELLSSDIRTAYKDLTENRLIPYPNHASFDGNINPNKKGTEKMNETNFSEEKTSFLTNVSKNAPSEDVDQNIYTMGAQAYYTEAMSQIRSNRHVKVDESILERIDRTSQKLSEKYGYDSKEYRKFLQKLKEYETKTEELQKLNRENKRRSLFIKLLSAVAGIVLIVGIVFLFNTNTFYANQGQYNFIYKRNILGSVELFKQVPALSLEKDGNKLYYINADDNLIYSTSTKQANSESKIIDDATIDFEIIGNYIYYINTDDTNKVYRINKDGSGKECIYDESCLSISVDKKYLEIVPEASPESPLLYNTKTSSLKDAIID